MNRQTSRHRCLLGLTVIVLTTGCASYKSDMDNLCHSVERSKARDLPIKEEDVLTIAASWAGERARSEDGLALLNAVAHVEPGSKGRVIRDAAREAGVMNCPFADELEASVLADRAQREREALLREQARSAKEPTAPTPAP
ncbi:hypothetical protein HUA74_44465 [Myxococcus sp. CA051A]|uniref:hypothetical protein n=1 Tax=unclassified Myxococcus TaxID=2648731 RepID=UPI00157B909C|nr:MULTISPECIES: hypothetical protein [unclassified Myxococcus]NTX56011.1 hypothetical protein [Myxococcus sp. CA039A]NTX67723.1 hypothetical protein [Myxococcus sp. CA051A]